jgi:hypothetical protein
LDRFPASPSAEPSVTVDRAVALGSELVAIAALDGEWLRPRKVFGTEHASG